MSLLSILFGGGKKSELEPVAYKGLEICPDPIAEGGKY
ncbi:HlyU family transcriptional regulator [Ruegeria sp. 2205SS24-7]|nr:HlyU family transcriptional regulator [Ruegeria sp. 2205SS24-7]MDP5217863.1 HlyU family transcriptional regulator [Ruegeria sp. 2205SS24-7]